MGSRTRDGSLGKQTTTVANSGTGTGNGAACEGQVTEVRVTDKGQVSEVTDHGQITEVTDK